MSTKIKGGAPQIPVGVDAQPLAHQAKTAQAQKAPRQDLNIPDLPDVQPGLFGAPSALQNVIQAGLDGLAKANNWQATDNALGVLVKAMVGAKATGKSADAGPIPATLPMEFQRLLKEFVPPGDATALLQLKKDAKQLVGLSVVALGTEGLEGLSRSNKEAQIEADVRAVHGAIADVLKLPTEQRAKLLNATDDLLNWKANVLDRAGPALKAAGVDTTARIDALAGMLKIVNTYASQA